MRLRLFSLTGVLFALSIWGLLLLSPSGTSAQSPTATPTLPPTATPIITIFESSLIVPTWRPFPSPIPIKPPEQRPNWLFPDGPGRYMHDVYIEWIGMTRTLYDIMSWGTKALNMFVQIWLFFLCVLYIRLIAQRVQNVLSGGLEPLKRRVRYVNSKIGGNGPKLGSLGRRRRK